MQSNFDKDLASQFDLPIPCALWSSISGEVTNSDYYGPRLPESAINITAGVIMKRASQFGNIVSWKLSGVRRSAIPSGGQ